MGRAVGGQAAAVDGGGWRAAIVAAFGVCRGGDDLRAGMGAQRKAREKYKEGGEGEGREQMFFFHLPNYTGLRRYAQ